MRIFKVVVGEQKKAVAFEGQLSDFIDKISQKFNTSIEKLEWDGFEVDDEVLGLLESSTIIHAVPGNSVISTISQSHVGEWAVSQSSSNIPNLVNMVSDSASSICDQSHESAIDVSQMKVKLENTYSSDTFDALYNSSMDFNSHFHQTLPILSSTFDISNTSSKTKVVQRTSKSMRLEAPQTLPKLEFSSLVEQYLHGSGNPGQSKFHHKLFATELTKYIEAHAPNEVSLRKAFLRDVKFVLKSSYPNCAFGAKDLNDPLRVDRVVTLICACIRQRSYQRKINFLGKSTGKKVYRRPTKQSALPLDQSNIPGKDMTLSKDEIVERIQETSLGNTDTSYMETLLQQMTTNEKLCYEKLPHYLVTCKLIVLNAHSHFPNLGFDSLITKIGHMKSKMERDKGQVLTNEDFICSLHERLMGTKLNECAVVFSEEHPDKGQYGPCLSYSQSTVAIWNQHEKHELEAESPISALAALLSTYYLLNLSYPARYGQFLICIQHMCLHEPFSNNSMSKKTLEFVGSK